MSRNLSAEMRLGGMKQFQKTAEDKILRFLLSLDGLWKNGEEFLLEPSLRS